MKKLILTLVCLIAVGFAGHAQWAVGAEYGHTVGTAKNYDRTRHYNHVGLNAYYSFGFKYGLSLNLEGGLYTQWNKATLDPSHFPTDGYTSTRVYHDYATGLSIGACGGKTLFSSLAVVTGPILRWNFYQDGSTYHIVERDGKTEQTPSTDSSYNGDRLTLYWKFGLTYDLSKIRISASYHLPVARKGEKWYPHNDVKTLGTLSAGIAYVF